MSTDPLILPQQTILPEIQLRPLSSHKQEEIESVAEAAEDQKLIEIGEKKLREIRIRQSIIDPKKFAKVWLDTDIWSKQAEILDAISTKSRVAVKACHSSSKCIAESEIITLGNGQRVRASELIGKTFPLPTLDEDGNVIVATAKAEFNATEEVFIVTTESGRQIIRNAHHPLWKGERNSYKGLSRSEAAKTAASRRKQGLPIQGDIRGKIVAKGWTAISELKENDLVAMALSLPIFGDIWINEEQLKVIAYLIGDGGLTGGGPTFTQENNAQLKELTHCVETLGGKVVPPNTNNWDGVSYNIVGASEEKIRVKSRTGSVPHRVNPITNLTREYGLFGKRSEKKFIPEKIFTLSKKQVSIFLSRLFSTDGWASTYKNESSSIGYSSVSERLIRDIAELLLRFGIVGTISSQPTSYVNKQGERIQCRVSWDISISGAEEVFTFCNEIGIYGKEVAVQKAKECSELRLKNKDLPNKFGQGTGRRWRKTNAAPGTFWEKVVSVESRGIESTVAIEVPDHGTYLTAFWEHNTFTAALVTLWFLARHTDEAVVITTAPTWGQVETLLWGEIRSALLRTKYPFPKSNKTMLEIGPKRYARGLSTAVTNQDEGVKFQGIHAKNVLVIIDEAPGVNPKIWEAIEGARAGGNTHVLAIGNPTISGGPFQRAFEEERAGWKCITIDAFDTPNLEGITLDQIIGRNGVTPLTEEELDTDILPFLTKRRWIKEMYHEWGEDHPFWESRVRGQFPKQSQDSLISLSWLEEAALRELSVAGQEVMAGIDVAGPGEAETSLTIRKGPKVVFHKQWPIADPTGEIVAALLEYKDVIKAVNVDCIGIGWGMYTHLVREGFPAIPVNVCEAANDSEKFVNIKSEFYWGLRLRLQAGDFCGLTDDKTIGQLAGIRYKPNSRGQIEIESKQDAAKRGMKSPDRAESVMLAFGSRTILFGALDYYKKMQQDLDRAKELEKITGQPANSAETAKCPLCSASCVVPCNNGLRCNACAHQWSLHPIKVVGHLKRNAALIGNSIKGRMN